MTGQGGLLPTPALGYAPNPTISMLMPFKGRYVRSATLRLGLTRFYGIHA